MAEQDLRLAKWNLTCSAGITQTIVFTKTPAAAITSLKVWVGGTVSDVDDTDDATPATATISGSSNEIATVSFAVPTSRNNTPLRLEVDGVIRTVGVLQPSTSGAAVAATTGLTLATDGASFDLTVAPGAVQTAAQILTAIKTVDGAGSGLDADLVDGNEASALLARANHTGTQAQSTVTNLVSDLAAKTPPFFDVTAPPYNATGNGTTNDSTAVNAAIQAAYDAEGGTVWFPAGTYRVDSLVIPNDGGVQPTQWTITLKGAGSFASGTQIALRGASVLDLRATTGIGRLDTRGHGLLVIEGLVFHDTVDSTVPFIHTTNTTLHCRGNAFVGNSADIRETCVIDAIVCGGTTNVYGTLAADAPFQGYGTVIDANYFDRIRRGVYGRSYFNGVVIQNNTWWATCGGTATEAAIEIKGYSPAEGDTGLMVTGNLIEMVGYVYGIMAENLYNSYFANNFYDFDGGSLACYRLVAASQFNTIFDVYRPDANTLASETGIAVGSNTIITGHQSQTSTFAQPVRLTDRSTGTTISKAIFASGGVSSGDAPLIQPAVALANNSVLVLKAVRSAAEPSNPGATIMQLAQNGKLTLGGDQGGALDFMDEAGTTVAQFTGALKNWISSGTGGAMSQNSGSGGSYLTLRNYGVKLLDHTGANSVTIKNGSGSPEGAFAAPVGSMWLRTDGGTGTTLYIKESGTGNTGWVAK